MAESEGPEGQPFGFFARLRTLGLALLVLVAGIGFSAALVITLRQNWGLVLPAFPAALIAGLVAMTFGWRFLQPWWRPVLALAPLGLVSLLYISPWWYLVAALVLGAIQWNAIVTRIPLYRSDASVAEILVQYMRNGQHKRFIDLGCGDGRLLMHMAKAMPDGHFVGVESAPFLYVIARWRCRHKANCDIHFRNFWKMDWGQFDLVFCFLSPEPMLRIWRKAGREMPESAALLSLAFEVPGIEPSELIGTPVFDLYEYRLSEFKKQPATASQ